MGSTRHAGTTRPRSRAAPGALGGGALSRWRRAGTGLLMLSAVEGWMGACRINPDLDAVIQITVAVVDSVEASDTLRAHASTGTARGDTVPMSFVWTSFDTTIL